MKEEVDSHHASQIPESSYIKLLNGIVGISTPNGKGTVFFLKFKYKNKLLFSLFKIYM